jgi:hypothetical protein
MDASVDGTSSSQPSPEYYIYEDGEGQVHPAGSPVRIKCSFANGFPTISSNENSDHLLVLRNGDDAPAMKASGGQASVETWLGAYLDSESGLIRLGNNQAIYLFEANSNNPWPSWETWSAWWINKGYHKYSQYHGTDWDEGDRNSYEFWNKKQSRRDYFLSNYVTDDFRDFQDCVVLASLYEPPDEPPVIVVGDTTTNNKPVKIQYSKDAMDMLNQLVAGVQAETTIVSIEWWDGKENKK